jgi:hypothetical protein
VQGGEENGMVVTLLTLPTLLRSWMHHCCPYYRTGKYNETYRLPQPSQNKTLEIYFTLSFNGYYKRKKIRLASLNVRD